MPTVSCVRDDLMAALGKEYTEKEFDELCFEFGIELDEVTSEAVMVRKEKGSAAAEKEQASEELIYKIDIPANRYDLLCIEGIARALRVYLGKEAVPVYRTLKPDTLITMTVGKETAQIRPYVVAAVLRNVKFTQKSYNSFIDLQVRGPSTARSSPSSPAALLWSALAPNPPLCSALLCLPPHTAAAGTCADVRAGCAAAGQVPREYLPQAHARGDRYTRPGHAHAAVRLRSPAPKGH
jgi:hypothetical protein